MDKLKLAVVVFDLSFFLSVTKIVAKAKSGQK